MSTPNAEDGVVTNNGAAEAAVSHHSAPGDNLTKQDDAAAAAATASSNGTLDAAGLDATDSPADPTAPPQVKTSLPVLSSPPKSAAEVWGSVVEQLSPTSPVARADQTQQSQPHTAGPAASPSRTSSAQAEQTQQLQPREAAAAAAIPSTTALNGDAALPRPRPPPDRDLDILADAPFTRATTRDRATEGYRDTAMEGHVVDSTPVARDSVYAVTANGGSATAAADDSSSSDDDLPLSMRTQGEPPGEAVVAGGLRLASCTPPTVNGTASPQGGRKSISSSVRGHSLTSASAPYAGAVAESRPRGHVSDNRPAPHQQSPTELRRSTSTDSAEVSAGDGSKKALKRALPKVKR